MWLHRRSEEPSPTEVECYWRKPKLASVGTKLKFVTVKDFGAVAATSRQQPFLQRFITRSKEENTSAQLLKYYSEESMQKLGLHSIICDFVSADKSSESFLKFAADRMSTEACINIFHATEAQSERSLWRDMRYGRITASKIYETARCKTTSGVLVESVIGALKVRETMAMKRGKTLFGKSFFGDILINARNIICRIKLYNDILPQFTFLIFIKKFLIDVFIFKQVAQILYHCKHL